MTIINEYTKDNIVGIARHYFSISQFSSKRPELAFIARQNGWMNEVRSVIPVRTQREGTMNRNITSLRSHINSLRCDGDNLPEEVITLLKTYLD